MTTRLIDAILERLETSQIGIEQAHESLCGLISTFYPEYFNRYKDAALRIQVIGLLQEYSSGGQSARVIARRLADIIDCAASRDPRLNDLIRAYR